MKNVCKAWKISCVILSKEMNKYFHHSTHGSHIQHIYIILNVHKMNGNQKKILQTQDITPNTQGLQSAIIKQVLFSRMVSNNNVFRGVFNVGGPDAYLGIHRHNFVSYVSANF